MLIPTKNKDSYEYDLTLPQFLRYELRSIPKPYFLCTLFPELPIAICRPLDPPFDQFAITHNGTVFLYQPLFIRNVIGYSFRTIHESSILQYNRENNPLVRIHTKLGTKTFFVSRLLLHYFYGIRLWEPVKVSFVDGDESNVHIANLEAEYL